MPASLQGAEHYRPLKQGLDNFYSSPEGQFLAEARHLIKLGNGKFSKKDRDDLIERYRYILRGTPDDLWEYAELSYLD